jgi:hypothetical protein
MGVDREADLLKTLIRWMMFEELEASKLTGMK